MSHGQVILSPLNKLLISEIANKRKGLFFFFAYTKDLTPAELALRVIFHFQVYFNFLLSKDRSR